MIIATSVKFIHLPIEDWARLVQIAAIIVGGIAAYIKWFRGRLYETRLEVSVTGSLIETSPRQLLAIARAKNVGLSKVSIRQEGSGLRVFSVLTCEPGSKVLSVGWKREATFPVFQEHEWIESNETIESQLLVTLPDGQSGAYRLELLLTSGKIVWKASGIANPAKPLNSIQTGDETNV
jgi:hypothetical protein